MEEKSLLSLEEGSSAVISSLTAAGAARRRLLDLGFTPGARVRYLYAAPAGSPRAYMIRGAVIALRTGDAGGVLLSGGGAWD